MICDSWVQQLRLAACDESQVIVLVDDRTKGLRQRGNDWVAKWPIIGLEVTSIADQKRRRAYLCQYPKTLAKKTCPMIETIPQGCDCPDSVETIRRQIHLQVDEVVAYCQSCEAPFFQF